LLMMAGVAHAEVEAPVMLRGKLQQAGFYVGKVGPGEIVRFNGVVLPVDASGTFVLGFDREQKQGNELKLCKRKTCRNVPLEVGAREYVTQNVTKVPQNTVEPNKQELAVIAADNKAIGTARALAWKHAAARYGDFGTPFLLPVKHGVTSGVFGSRRTYNGEERSWHRGHDLAAPTGTPVRAPAAGVVRLARWTFMTGNLLMLDHGAGITSVYAHLSKMDVKAGQKVKAGQVIGKVGTTGRSSGPHLHWGMYWQSVPIDPILWVQAAVDDGVAAKE